MDTLLYNKLFTQHRDAAMKGNNGLYRKKNGRVYCGKSLDELKQFGIAKADKEFESTGSMARIMDGKIFIGKTDKEIQAERKQTRTVEIENHLLDIDTKSGRVARVVASPFR